MTWHTTNSVRSRHHPTLVGPPDARALGLALAMLEGSAKLGAILHNPSHLLACNGFAQGALVDVEGDMGCLLTSLLVPPEAVCGTQCASRAHVSLITSPRVFEDSRKRDTQSDLSSKSRASNHVSLCDIGRRLDCFFAR